MDEKEFCVLGCHIPMPVIWLAVYMVVFVLQGEDGIH